MKILKYPICMIVGHKLDSKSIINFIDSGNYLKRCSRCGLFHARSNICSVTITEKRAMKLKSDFENEFPYAKERDGE